MPNYRMLEASYVYHCTSLGPCGYYIADMLVAWEIELPAVAGMDLPAIHPWYIPKNAAE